MFEKENEVWINKLGPEGSGKLADVIRGGIRKSFINRVLDQTFPGPEFATVRKVLWEVCEGKALYSRLTGPLRIYADRFYTEVTAAVSTQEEHKVWENLVQIKKK